jgi:inorganic phosphate transporter, PiT family
MIQISHKESVVRERYAAGAKERADKLCCLVEYESEYLKVIPTVSFARGLSDTPKIVALLLLWKALDISWGFAAIALTMAIGGLLNARKVAETMSKKITVMNHGQGFTANLTTAILVVLASLFGLPVSTTHVSVGSLFGIGLTTGKANYPMISAIVFSWLVTLPTAAILAATTYWLTARLA